MRSRTSDNGVFFTDLVVPQIRPIKIGAEELIFGEELEDGMVVLQESPIRAHVVPETEASEDKKRDIMTRNRWCEVGRLRKDKDGMIHFIGTYADGQQAVRFSNPTFGWLVKKPDVYDNPQ